MSYRRVIVMRQGDKEEYAVEESCLEEFVEAANYQGVRILYIGGTVENPDTDPAPIITPYSIGYIVGKVDDENMEDIGPWYFIPSYLLHKALAGANHDTINVYGPTCENWEDPSSVLTKYQPIFK